MNGPELKFEFSERIEFFDDAYQAHGVPLPAEIADTLWAAGHRRVLGTINGHPFRRAMLGSARDGRYLMFGKKVLADFGLGLGSPVEVMLEADPDPDYVEVPIEFEEALAQDPEAKARWDTFSPGKRRGLCHYVSQAKREETRIRRATEATAKIREYRLHGDMKR